LNYSSRNSW